MRKQFTRGRFYVPSFSCLALFYIYANCYNILYSTKHSRDKTFAVRSPCEYSQKNFRGCIKNFLILVIALENSWMKHSWFKVRLRNPRTFCPSNVLFYTVFTIYQFFTCAFLKKFIISSMFI